MNMETLTIYHLIKSEDLNHHGTLFAGRGAEWMVEAGFVAAANFAAASVYPMFEDPRHGVHPTSAFG